jgi:hypothetical protein
MQTNETGRCFGECVRCGTVLHDGDGHVMGRDGLICEECADEEAQDDIED